MKITETKKDNKTIIRINGKIQCFYKKMGDDSYNFYLGKPSDRMNFTLIGITENELKREIQATIDTYYGVFFSF